MTNIAICQMNIHLGQVALNLEKIRDSIYTAAEERADLVVFPELSLTGYSIEDDMEIAGMAPNSESNELKALSDICRQQRIIAVVGFIEQSTTGLYNTAGIFGTTEDLLRYRKVHLPAMGVDRFLTRGDLGFPVFELPNCRAGLNICYDQLFPESARSLAVQGAQLVIVPTSEIQAQHEMTELLIRTRAYENRVFYAWANRVGEESDMIFTGTSRIVSPLGEIMTMAGSFEEELIYCEIDPAQADDKRAFDNTDFPGYQHDLFQDRSPENYTPLVDFKKW